MSLARKGMRPRWREHVIHAHRPKIGESRLGRLDGETRALLIVIADDYMDDAGRVRVLREVLADRFDVHPRRITERIQRAVEAGFLDRRGGGWNGRAKEYEALLPTIQKVRPNPPPTAQEEVASNQPPSVEDGGGRAATNVRPLRAASASAKVAGGSDAERARVTYERREIHAVAPAVGDSRSVRHWQERTDEEPRRPDFSPRLTEADSFALNELPLTPEVTTNANQ